MHKKKTLLDYSMRFIPVLCTILLTYILLHYIASNILYARCGITNKLVQLFVAVEPEDEAADTPNNTAKKKDIKPIDWEALYPFSQTVQTENIHESAPEQARTLQQLMPEVPLLNRYTGLIKRVEAAADYFSDRIPFYSNIIRLSRKIQLGLGYNLQSPSESDAILYMKNGYLTSSVPQVSEAEIEEIADSVSDFQSFLVEQDIPFLYVNAGYKVCSTDRQLDSYLKEYSYENGSALLSALTERGVDTLDFREQMRLGDLDWYGSYYKTDHHWKTETGLWAAGVIAERLNQSYEFSFDLNRLNPECYRQTTYPHFWLGGQGRRDAFANSDLEDFTLILPDFATNFTLLIPSKELELNGNYSNTLVDLKLLEQIKNYSRQEFLEKRDAYNCSRIQNDPLTTIENHLSTNNNGKKILFLQDSFAWYSTGFLACDLSNVDVLHPMSFTGSIRSYIEKTKPDMVVMMYCEKNICPINWQTHNSPFDLR